MFSNTNDNSANGRRYMINAECSRTWGIYDVTTYESEFISTTVVRQCVSMQTAKFAPVSYPILLSTKNIALTNLKVISRSYMYLIFVSTRFELILIFDYLCI